MKMALFALISVLAASLGTPALAQSTTTTIQITEQLSPSMAGRLTMVFEKANLNSPDMAACDTPGDCYMEALTSAGSWMKIMDVNATGILLYGNGRYLPGNHHYLFGGTGTQWIPMLEIVPYGQPFTGMTHAWFLYDNTNGQYPGYPAGKFSERIDTNSVATLSVGTYLLNGN